MLELRRDSPQVDARVALHGVRAIAEWRLGDVSRALSVIVDTEEVKSSIWQNMLEPLGRLSAADPQANVIRFVRPDGYYYSVERGFTGLNLSVRSYFPGLMAGQRILGALAVSLSTGKRSVIIAELVRFADRVIVGVSYSVDKLSVEIDAAMQLPPAAVFYALDMNGQAGLHRDPALTTYSNFACGRESYHLSSVTGYFRETISFDRGSVPTAL